MFAFHISTLGCKLNQFDSADLAGMLRGSMVRVADPSMASLVVVNTCTVTGAADADARQIIRRRRRESPRALIVAMGCYAERAHESLHAMPEVDLVLRRQDRPEAARIVLEHLRRRFPMELSDGCADRVAEESLPDFGGRSRAFLRVQEGCDLRCAYCVIPSVRGPSLSVPPAMVERRFRVILEAGFREIVLTGVNTGDYGKDLADPSDLVQLLERLLHIEGDFRVRLNSVEPRCVTPPLVDLLASHSKLAQHLQIPLQSGSDFTLRTMRRNYRVADYRRVVEDLRSRIPDIGLGADVIVGFPSEEERHFEETMDFIRSSPLNYLHVFSYSRRPGTDAAKLAQIVAGGTVSRRSRLARSLGRELARAFARKQSGRPLRALVMRGRRKDGRQRALTSNFIEVALAGDAPENSFLPVWITSIDSMDTAHAQAA